MPRRIQRVRDGSPPLQSRATALEELSTTARAVYRHLKARHIDGEGREEKVATMDALARTVRGDVEGAVEQLVDRRLAVRRQDAVMWRPVLSRDLGRTLEGLQAGDGVPESDADSAAVLAAIGLVDRVGGGYRYPWDG